MSTVAVVTSCSADGYKQYGARMVETFLAFWPHDMKLYVVSEDALTLPAGPEFVSLNDAPQPVADFYARHANNPRAHGDRGNVKNFKYDAFKFSKKVFAVEMVAARTEVDRLIWLDADVETFAGIPPEFVRSMPPNDNFALSCLDRGPHYHSECGFVSYNLRHPQTRRFITDFARLYTSDEVFNLKEWHDSWVFDWLRRRMKLTCHRIPHKSNGHPFVHSKLGEFMDHFKGRRKEAGRSSDHPRYNPKPKPHASFRPSRRVHR